MKVKTSKGFTLAELLIVMAIVVVLAAVAVPTFGRQLETSRETSDMETIRNCYSEVLTVATRDSMDGLLDMNARFAPGATVSASGDNANAVAITYAGITGADATGESATGYVYTVTLANLDSKPAFKQGTAGWQFVDNHLFGVEVPATITQATVTISFTFEIADTGNLVLTAMA